MMAAALVVCLLAPLAALLSMQRLEPVAADRAVTALLGKASDPAGIVVVAISEETLAALPYRSPVDRGFLADLIARIDRAGPRAIGLDILIDQPSEAAKDARLRAAIGGATAPVVMGLAGERDGLTARQAAFLKRATTDERRGLVALSRDAIDGVVRRHTRARTIDGVRVRPFADALVRAAGVVQSDPSGPGGGRILYATDGAGGPFRFPVYPAHQAALLPDAWFAGKIVLIGSDLPDSDRHPTPFSSGVGAGAGALPGVLIHAHMLADARSPGQLAVMSPWMRIALAFLAAALAAGLFLLPLRPWLRYLLLLALAGAYLLVALGLIAAGTVLSPLLAPPVAALFAGAALSLATWHRDWSEHRFIRSAFARYVSPAVVERIAAHRLDLTLGGEKRRVTYVFTDLEGFTALSERLPAIEVAAVLNAYLDQLCDLFSEAGATIDKIVGDAVVGFFGAPADDPEQERRAVDLALAIDRFSEGHRARLAARGLSIGVTRVGVHCGDAVVGNFGGSRFFDYTGVGDTVNVASRLEGANKALGTRILVSEAVASADPAHRFRSAARLRLKGRGAALYCLTPLGEGSEAGEARQVGAAQSGANWPAPAWLERWEEGFRRLQEGKIADAEAAFRAVAAELPDDLLARCHLERLRQGAVDTVIVLAEK